MNVSRPLIEHAVDVELIAARREHEDFHSLHEAYAVTLEEVDEAKEELNLVEACMGDLWASIRYDSEDEAMKELARIEKCAVNLAAEAVQVAAMARKARRIGNENKTWFGKE